MIQSLPDDQRTFRQRIQVGCAIILCSIALWLLYIFLFQPLYTTLVTMPASPCQPITYPDADKMTDAIPTEAFKRTYRNKVTVAEPIHEVYKFYEDRLSPIFAHRNFNNYSGEWYWDITVENTRTIACVQEIGFEAVLVGCIHLVKEDNYKTQIYTEFREDFALAIGCYAFD